MSFCTFASPESLDKDQCVVKIPAESLTEYEQTVFLRAVAELFNPHTDGSYSDELPDAFQMLVMKLKFACKGMGAYGKFKIIENTP